MLTGTEQDSILHHIYLLCALVFDPHEKKCDVSTCKMLYERTLWVIFFNSIFINALYYKCILNYTINYTLRGLKIDECF